MTRTEPCVLLLTGNQASGKTTVGRLVAQRFDRGAFVEADALQAMIVSGAARVEPPGPQGEAARQLELRGRHACMLAASLHDEGFTVVVEDILGAESLERFRGWIGERPTYLVVLAPSLGSLRNRDAGRAEGPLFSEWGEALDRMFARELGGRGLWVDSSEQSPSETADEILSRVWDEGRI